MPENVKVSITKDTHVLAYKAKDYQSACVVVNFLFMAQIKLDELFIKDIKKQQEKNPGVHIFNINRN